MVVDGRANALIEALQKESVNVHWGARLLKSLPQAGKTAVDSFRVEYGSLDCAVEVVDDMDQALDHIHANGSGHTEVIVTDDAQKAAQFQHLCDSPCVFHNASSRFADGFRFGLGAEVGISTSRIHARGPVGVEGLLSTTFKLHGNGHTVESIAEGQHVYTHKTL